MSGEGRQHACVNFLPVHTSAVICFRVVERKCDLALFGFWPKRCCCHRRTENSATLDELSAVHFSHANASISYCKIAVTLKIPGTGVLSVMPCLHQLSP